MAEWKREQGGSSTDSQVAFGPKLLLLPALPRHRPQAYVMRPRMKKQSWKEQYLKDSEMIFAVLLWKMN